MVEPSKKIVFERTLSNGTGSLRVVIPLELAKTLNFHAGEPVEIWLEENHIAIRKKDAQNDSER